jgi:hypothetical protein
MSLQACLSAALQAPPEFCRFLLLIPIVEKIVMLMTKSLLFIPNKIERDESIAYYSKK